MYCGAAPGGLGRGGGARPHAPQQRRPSARSRRVPICSLVAGHGPRLVKHAPPATPWQLISIRHRCTASHACASKHCPPHCAIGEGSSTLRTLLRSREPGNGRLTYVTGCSVAPSDATELVSRLRTKKALLTGVRHRQVVVGSRVWTVRLSSAVASRAPLAFESPEAQTRSARCRCRQ